MGCSHEPRFVPEAIRMSVYAEFVAMSNFSFLRGASHPEEMAIQARALGLSALAICDRNSLAGVVRAHSEAKKQRLRFVVGCRLVLASEKEIACLPTDRAAYGRLCQLLTIGNRRAKKGECHLTLDDVLEFGEGQIFIGLPPPVMAGLDPPIQPVATDRHKAGDNVAASAFAKTLVALRARFPGAMYPGAAPRLDGRDARRFMHLAQLAEQTGAPLVAIGDCLYHHPDRRPLQDVLTCIREKCIITEAGLRLEANAERHLRPTAEMFRLFRGYEDAVTHTAEIAALPLLARRTEIRISRRTLRAL
jgi:error-prone DNA polymerase